MVSVAGMLPRRQRQAIARVSVSALAASLPLLYVSLRKPPPAALAGDTAFWFLMSNCVIAAIVATADDDALFFGSSSSSSSKGGGGGGDPFDGGGRHWQAVVPPPLPALAVVAASDDEPATTVVVDLKGGEVASTVAATSTRSNNSVDPLKLNHTNIQIQQEGGEDEVAIGEPMSTDDKHIVMLEEGEEGIASPTPASEAAAMIPVGNKPAAAITKAAGKASLLAAEPPDPRAPKLVTRSKSLPEKEEEEKEPADDDWPAAPVHSSRPPGVLLARQQDDKNRDGRLRRWATEGSASKSKQAAEDDRGDSEYWELSDEELNRRVENFIARFNREMRLQIEQDRRQELATYPVEI